MAAAPRPTAARTHADAETALGISLFDAQLSRAREEVTRDEARLAHLRGLCQTLQTDIDGCDVTGLHQKIMAMDTTIAKQRAVARAKQADAAALVANIGRLQGPRVAVEAAATELKGAVRHGKAELIEAATARLVPAVLSCLGRDTITMVAERQALDQERAAANGRCDKLRGELAALRRSAEADRAAGAKSSRDDQGSDEGSQQRRPLPRRPDANGPADAAAAAPPRPMSQSQNTAASAPSQDAEAALVQRAEAALAEVTRAREAAAKERAEQLRKAAARVEAVQSDLNVAKERMDGLESRYADTMTEHDALASGPSAGSACGKCGGPLLQPPQSAGGVGEQSQADADAAAVIDTDIAPSDADA